MIWTDALLLLALVDFSGSQRTRKGAHVLLSSRHTDFGDPVAGRRRQTVFPYVCICTRQRLAKLNKAAMGADVPSTFFAANRRTVGSRAEPAKEDEGEEEERNGESREASEEAVGGANGVAVGRGRGREGGSRRQPEKRGWG